MSNDKKCQYIFTFSKMNSAWQRMICNDECHIVPISPYLKSAELHKSYLTFGSDLPTVNTWLSIFIFFKLFEWRFVYIKSYIHGENFKAVFTLCLGLKCPNVSVSKCRVPMWPMSLSRFPGPSSGDCCFHWLSETWTNWQTFINITLNFSLTSDVP